MQYYGAILSKGVEDKGLLSWFTGKDLDPRAKLAAEKLWNEHKEFIEVDHIYPTGDLEPFGTYDLYIHTDWGEDGLTGILPYKPIETPHPFAYWASDTHLGYEYRMTLAKKADFAFCAQKRAVEEMRRDGVANPIWLPHAVEPLAYPKGEVFTKHHDVCFIGHVNSANRVEALDRLFREFQNFDYGQALFEGAAARYADAKVCFNIAMTDDVNMRNFEIMASGSLLLTSHLPDFEDLGADRWEAPCFVSHARRDGRESEVLHRTR
jgi:hypothetical protein